MDRADEQAILIDLCNDLMILARDKRKPKTQQACLEAIRCIVKECRIVYFADDKDVQLLSRK